MLLGGKRGVSRRSPQKTRVLESVQAFRRAMIPCALNLDESVRLLMQEGGYADPLVAADILLDAAYDVDLNCALHAIRYHVDEYLLQVR
jgi:hypothetical protein